MRNNTIFISGINGFVGRNLGRYFSNLGWTVSGSSRQRVELDFPVSELFVYDLKDEPQRSFFQGVDSFVHCAHDFSRQAYEINLRGSQELLAMAQQEKVRKMIFISSYSADAQAKSLYGKTKFKIEQLFLEKDGSVVRPGLVVGRGGMFARIRNKILRLPLTPLLDAGEGPSPVIDGEDFCEALLKITAMERSGLFHLFAEPVPSQKDLAVCLREKEDKSTRVIPVPVSLAEISLRVLSFLPLGLSSDSVASYKVAKNFQRRSDLYDLIEKPKNLKEMIHGSIE